MAIRFSAVCFDARRPLIAATFWGRLLGREVVQEAGGPLVPGDGTQLGLRFVAADAERAPRDHLHLHLTSTGLADQRQTVARALELGARHLDVGQRPEEPHVVLADPEGYPFDVIEPGNAFLAGCGFLGEVTCDGPREAGQFWSEALGWPLVWDRGAQTAIQSPHGGTKVSWDVWGNPPGNPAVARNRQRFELAPPVGGDPRTEVERLVALGAVPLGTDEDGAATLADPAGDEFRLLPPR